MNKTISGKVLVAVSRGLHETLGRNECFREVRNVLERGRV